jgi:hypothetical protein
MGEGVGTFQQAPQMPVAAPVTKWSAKIPSLTELPRALSLAFRHATYGRPGPVYIEIPVRYYFILFFMLLVGALIVASSLLWIGSNFVY